MALKRMLALTLAALVATPALAQQAPSPAIAAAAALADSEPSADAWPKGAPHEDYEFTAWCYGVLKRHMELYDEVKPELTAISKRWKTEDEDNKSYSEQHDAGVKDLALFRNALTDAEKASPRPINVQGAAAIEQGRQMWNQFGTVDKTWQAYSWMNWELPERCEKVAKALDNKSVLFGQALSANVANKSTAKPKPAAKPAPAKD